MISYTNSTKFNSSAVYSCNDDYVLKGETTRVCQADGEWSNSDSTCVGMCITLSVAKLMMHISHVIIIVRELM